MRKVLALVTLAAALAAGQATAVAGQGSAKPLSIAGYGDSPYGVAQGDQTQEDLTPAFIDSINADRDVSLVLHVGDIHSGKQFCTEPYDELILGLWKRFEDPLVYTPGDNEWTDCHKKAQGGGLYNATTGQIDYEHNADGSLAG